MVHDYSILRLPAVKGTVLEYIMAYNQGSRFAIEDDIIWEAGPNLHLRKLLCSRVRHANEAAVA
jgi:hypothetical protein